MIISAVLVWQVNPPRLPPAEAMSEETPIPAASRVAADL
jgi:hypothetical protein